MIKIEGTTLHLGTRLRVRADRFPWQLRRSAALLSSDSERKGLGKPYGWRGTDGMGRFGGGWNWALGFRIGGRSIHLDLLIGFLSISWGRK